MIFRKEYFFGAKDNNETMLKIISVLGSEDYFHYINSNGLKPDKSMLSRAHGFEKRQWLSFINSDNKTLVSHEAFDLLDKMLVYDPNQRITPLDALDHEYFDEE